MLGACRDRAGCSGESRVAGGARVPVPLAPPKPEQPEKGARMNVNLTLAPLVALIAGILILVVPRLLNYIVAIYLIIIGLIGIFGTGSFNFR
jgi:hypothetical protein